VIKIVAVFGKLLLGSNEIWVLRHVVEAVNGILRLRSDYRTHIAGLKMLAGNDLLMIRHGTRFGSDGMWLPLIRMGKELGETGGSDINR